MKGLLALAIAPVLLVAPALAAPVEILPGQDIQAIVDAHPGETTFIIKKGIHRFQQVRPKSGNVFLGETGAVLTGSRSLDPADFEWDGQFWTASVDLSELEHNGEPPDQLCEDVGQIDFLTTDGTLPYFHPFASRTDSYTECLFRNDLYINDKFLWRVKSKYLVYPGAWYFDEPGKRIFMKNSPLEAKIEISVTPFAFKGNVSGVTIRNLVIEKYASRERQEGTVEGGVDWIVENNEIRFNHANGLVAKDGSIIRNNYIHHNGQMGIRAGGDDLVFENNILAFNNVRGYRNNWETGGVKFAHTENLVVRNNCVHDNYGPGLWADIDNVNALFEGNYVLRNQRMGIYHEIGFKAEIRDNIVLQTAYNYSPSWMWDANICLSSSSDTAVHGNVVEVAATGGNGISIVDNVREGYVAHNNTVYENEIIYLGNSGRSGAAATSDDPLFWTTNVFDRNTYHAPDLDQPRWNWLNGKTWNGFRAVPQEQNGTADTNVSCVLAYPPPRVGPIWAQGGNACLKDYEERLQRGCRLTALSPHPAPH